MAMMEYLLSPRGIIKLSELVLIIITLGTWFGLITNWRDFITGTVFTSFFSGLAIFTQNMLTTHARVVEILISGVMCLFLAISGIIVLVKISGDALAATCGAFCFITAVVYAVDVFFAFKLDSGE